MNKKETELNKMVRLYSGDIPFIKVNKQKSYFSLSKLLLKRVLKAKTLNKECE